LTQNTTYRIVFNEPIVTGGVFQGWNGVESTISLGTRNGISSYSITFIDWKGSYTGKTEHCIAGSNPSSFPPAGQRFCTVLVTMQTGNGQQTQTINTTLGMKVLRIEQTNPALRSQICRFKIFRQGVEVRQEVRATCPEVQVIPCSLDPTGIKSFKITKDRFISRVDVTNKSVTQVFLPPSNTPVFEIKDLPPECLNVYVASVVAPPFVASNLPSPGFELWDFKAQICSMVGCPPPTYEVLCEDCCESCPDGTCALECDGKICCYNDYGLSVREIELTNYCGGG
jgi:hypothetical protein